MFEQKLGFVMNFIEYFIVFLPISWNTNAWTMQDLLLLNFFLQLLLQISNGQAH